VVVRGVTAATVEAAMVTRYQISEGKVVAVPDEPAPIWVFTSPTDEERRLLIDELGIDEHNLASALDPDELSRLELEPGHAAVILKRPKSYTAEDNLQFRVISVGMFVFKERLVIVMSSDAPLFHGRPTIPAYSVTDVMLRLISRSIYHFVEHLRIIN
jgi:magnesium transporter